MLVMAPATGEEGEWSDGERERERRAKCEALTVGRAQPIILGSIGQCCFNWQSGDRAPEK